MSRRSHKQFLLEVIKETEALFISKAEATYVQAVKAFCEKYYISEARTQMEKLMLNDRILALSQTRSIKVNEILEEVVNDEPFRSRIIYAADVEIIFTDEVESHLVPGYIYQVGDQINFTDVTIMEVEEQKILSSKPVMSNLIVKTLTNQGMTKYLDASSDINNIASYITQLTERGLINSNF